MNQQQKNDFVYKTLADVINRTEDTVSDLMERAIIAPNPITGIGSPWCSRPATEEEKRAFRDNCRKMAIKFLWILWNSERVAPKHGRKAWIPTQSCVDLSTMGAALIGKPKHKNKQGEMVPATGEYAMTVDEVRIMWAIDEDAKVKSKRKSRKFKSCLGCGRRFLAKRGNNLTCSARCRQRYGRKSSMSQIQVVGISEDTQNQ